MTLPQNRQNLQQMKILLEILPEDPSEKDPALLQAIERDTIDALEHDGYTIQSVATGQRGGGPLVEVITTATTIATSDWAMAWANREVVEHIMNDTSALVTVCGGVVSVLHRLIQAHRKRMKQAHPTSPQPPSPIKITVEIDGAPVTLETVDVEQAEAVMKMVQQFQTHHPAVAAKTTAKSKVKVTATVPKKPQRKRR